MNSADWTEANQRLLTAELASLRHRLGSAIEAPATEPPDASALTALDSAIVQANAAMPAPAAIDIVCELFGLSRFERSLLLLCCGVELDAQLAAACARIHGSETRRNASFGLALAALPEGHWSALTPARPLRRWHLLEVDGGLRLVDSPLRVDERILHFVAGINLLDVRLRPLLTLHEPPRLISAAHELRPGEVGLDAGLER